MATAASTSLNSSVTGNDDGTSTTMTGTGGGAATETTANGAGTGEGAPDEANNATVDDKPPSPQSYPWKSCMFGCEVADDKEVTLLPCLHVLCSEKCSAKILAEVKPGGSPPECRSCHIHLTRDDLSNKIILNKEFRAKETFAPPAENFVCDNCVFDRPAIAYCPDCPDGCLLCEQCLCLHPQARATVNHVIERNLDSPRQKHLASFQEKSVSCMNHPGENLTSICLNCAEKLCVKCLPGHDGEHEVLNVQEEKDKLKKSLDVALKFMDKCDELKSMLTDKRKSILTNDWPSVMQQCDDQFAMMVNTLAQRHKDIIREVKLRLSKQTNELRKREKIMSMSKKNADELIKAGKQLMDELDDTATVNFIKHSKKNLDWIADFSKKLTQDSDRFSDKNWHFSLDRSGHLEAQKYLEKYCQVEYSFMPNINSIPSETRKLRTYGVAKKKDHHLRKKSPAKDGSTAKDMLGNGVGTGTGRNLAVKSTGKGPSEVVCGMGVGLTAPTFLKVVKGWTNIAPPPSTSPTSDEESLRLNSEDFVDQVITEHVPVIGTNSYRINGNELKAMEMESSTQIAIATKPPILNLKSLEPAVAAEDETDEEVMAINSQHDSSSEAIPIKVTATLNIL